MNDAITLTLYLGAIGLMVIGIAGVVLSGHLFRVVMALAIAEAGANLLLVLTGFRWDAVAPIITGATSATSAPMVDPIPQALVLTAIVIGVGVQALALAIGIRLRQAYGTLDLRVIRTRMLEEIDGAAGIAQAGSQERPAGKRPLPPPQPAALSQEARS